jgi:hypothetical protein
MFVAAYVGPSMNPTLRESEMMEILPYGRRPLSVGDVVFFLSPASDQPVVHRIARLTPSGISTLGDNNNREDAFLLQPQHIKGQVVAAWRGQKRRVIAGGIPGRFISCWFRWRKRLDYGVAPLLHPIYRALSYKGRFIWLLPEALHPRVVVFHTRGLDQFLLLSGKRIIGRYDDYRQKWHVQRPFHLFVDAAALPGQKDTKRVTSPVLSERPLALNLPRPQGALYSLALADGSHWEISAENEDATSIVSQLGNAMQLSTAPEEINAALHYNLRRLLVQVNAHPSVVDGYVPLAPRKGGNVACFLSPCSHWGGPHVNLVRLSLIIARESQARGGFLIHGALAERHGAGVILAAPGGTGKTTASNRFSLPWRSLSDDTTLVVRDRQGNYWAHPWPTWSRFMDEGPCGTWDVQRAVPLKRIFFLSRSTEDRVERVGPGHAVSLLAEFVRQVTTFMAPGLSKEELRTLHLERFDNLCALARVMPVHRLHLSLTGAFWKEIETTLSDEM